VIGVTAIGRNARVDGTEPVQERQRRAGSAQDNPFQMLEVSLKSSSHGRP
jgi:hypothetical protein